ncbi:hypothetical protein Bpfe_024035 [Biomphalaria pfeifferi]|uniref:Uncharacterized protein n=1 Tax=Biomphalaria pfeifferi TaxID=112525 RepID=A0AAD8EZS1_BIOPF|nr:hypothetical protein Bpfe_024035 [Biomphalaria pfeifferi]
MDYISMTTSNARRSQEYVQMSDAGSECSIPSFQENCRVPLMMDTDHPKQDSLDEVDAVRYLEANNTTGHATGNEVRPCAIPPMPTKKPRVFTKQKDVQLTDSELLADDQEKRYRGASLIKPQTLWTNQRANGQESCQGGAAGANGHSEDYQNDPTNYLTPTESPHYSGSFFRFSTDETATGSDDSNQIRGQRSRTPFTRFDSGVDCSTERGSTSTTISNIPSESPRSITNPRLSTHQEQHYEDIDTYSKKQPPSEGKKGITNNSISSNGSCLRATTTRPLPEVNVFRRDTLDNDVNEPILNSSIAETVSSTLNDPTLNFDPRLATLPHTYTQLDIGAPRGTPAKKVSPKERQRCCAAFTLPVVLVFIISISALTLSIYVLITSKSRSEMTGVFSSDHSKQNIHLLVQELNDRMLKLEQENIALRNQLSEHASKLLFIEDEVEILYNTTFNTSLALYSMKDALMTSISNISLLPGPQGKPGIVNFSLCVNTSISKTAPSSTTEQTITDLQPDSMEAKKYFVMFAYCTYIGATDAQLVFEARTGQYKCLCYGHINSKTFTVCTVHVMMCPR